MTNGQESVKRVASKEEWRRRRNLRASGVLGGVGVLSFVRLASDGEIDVEAWRS